MNSNGLNKYRMKKLFVCGDSWMSPNIKHPDTHFSEIFAKKLGFELISYAHPGMGNGAISIQIETAIKNKADLILFNSTSLDRIEFIKNTKVEKDVNLESFSVSDLLYSESSALSTLQKGNNDSASLVSDSLNSLISLIDSKIQTNLAFAVPNLESKLKIIKEYVSELYYPAWKSQLDRMLMYAIANKLHLSNIPYVYCFDHIGATSNHNDFFWTWLEPKNYISDKFDIFMGNTNKLKFDPGYHTSYETQIEMADILFAHYNSYF